MRWTKNLSVGFLALCSMAFWSCSSPGAYSISLVFPDNDSKQMTKSMRLVLVRPSESANCDALISADAVAGDGGYEIEDETSFSLPMGDEDPFLEIGSGGRVLFFAQGSTAEGQVIVNGCADVQAKLGGVQDITIDLSWTRKPCSQDADCNDDDPCTDDACELGLCSTTPAQVGTSCDDGNFCTVADTCDAHGNCGGQERDCSQLDEQCQKGACDEQQDSCIAVPANEGQPCDDNLFCTRGEACHDGVCGGGSLTDCDDGMDCTLDSCDEQSGSCAHEPTNELCDDGIPCTTDTCDATRGCIHEADAGACPSFHIGPAEDACPHLDSEGSPTSACDFFGTDGLSDAVASASGKGAAFFLYDDSGARFGYEACTLDIPGSSLVSAADGINRKNVILACTDDSIGQNGILHMDGDNIHVKDVTFVNLRNSNAAISAWPALHDPSGATKGHLIENVVGRALQPELVGSNGIEVPLRIGSDTTVRNCLFSGFYDHHFFLADLSNVRIVGNTFVYFQTAEGPMELEGSSGIVFANNLVLSLTNTQPLLASASSDTTGLVLSGNVLEGYSELVSDLDPADETNLVQGNYQEQAQVESPLVPLFLSDASQQTDGTVTAQGYSLDGVSIDGLAFLLPGAYQHRSSRSGPRRMSIRLGDGNCGANVCDFTPEDDNEVQKAVFSSWPGGTIEIYPYNDYAGDAIIPWGLHIKGMGGGAEEVILKSREEDLLSSQAQMWERHASILVALHHMELPVHLENMSFVVDPDSQADDRAVLIEGKLDSSPAEWHVLRHLVVSSIAGQTPGLKQAFYLGDHVLLTDSLIHGAFRSCIRFGPRRSEESEAPSSSDRIVNLTCRLNGTGDYTPESALDVASVVDTYFVNLAIEMETPGAFLRAQRRSVGDTGTTALDVPISYTLNAVTVKGQNTHTDGYEPSDGDYSNTDLTYLDTSDPFFISESSSYLVHGCRAFDGGVDPALVSSDLEAGVSLDGLDRQTATAIDQGCYEQE